MKKYIFPLLLIISGLGMQSCLKQDLETKSVTINDHVQIGSTYSLDLNQYGGPESKVEIRTQALHYSVSQVDREPAFGNYVYHYSVNSKQAENEKIVIEVRKNNRCNHDSKTVVTINLTVD